jgi:hypothetical protein
MVEGPIIRIASLAGPPAENQARGLDSFASLGGRYDVFSDRSPVPPEEIP